MPNYHPAPLPPLRTVDAYTSWPGGVDPTVKLYRIDNQAGGKKTRRNRKATRRSRRSTSRSRKNRRS